MSILSDPAGAYRELDERLRAANTRMHRATDWQHAINADIAYYTRRIGPEYDDANSMLDGACREIARELADVMAEWTRISDRRAELDATLDANGLDWRDYDGVEEYGHG